MGEGVRRGLSPLPNARLFVKFLPLLQSFQINKYEKEREMKTESALHSLRVLRVCTASLHRRAARNQRHPRAQGEPGEGGPETTATNFLNFLSKMCKNRPRRA